MDDETKRAERRIRDEAIYQARQNGLTPTQIGLEHGITAERVRQICRAMAREAEERSHHGGP